MFRFRTSALSWLPKIWSSTSALSTAKDLKFHVRTFVLHWLPKIWSSVSALPICLDCQICEVLLPYFRSALTVKDLKFHFPHLFCQDFKICKVPLPHFVSAWTSKDLQFRFCTFAQSWLPKIWRSASPLTLCLHCQIWEVPPPHFPTALIAKDRSLTFQICLHSQRCERTSALPWLPKFCLFSSAVGSYCVFPYKFRAVLPEGLDLQRDEASLFASKKQNHLIHT